MTLDLIFRWIHILSAVALAGGAIFMRFSLAPALAQQSAETRRKLLDGWRPGWSKVVMASSGLLLVSGLFNGARNIIQFSYPDLPVRYDSLVAVKLLLALVVFWLSAVLAGRSQTAEKFREKMTFWLNINVALAVLVVLLGGYMKSGTRVPKERDAVEATTAFETPMATAEHAG